MIFMDSYPNIVLRSYFLEPEKLPQDTESQEVFACLVDDDLDLLV